MTIAKTTIRQFAEEMGQSSNLLLAQLLLAGIHKTGENDLLTENDKSSLLKFLLRKNSFHHEAKIETPQSEPPPPSIEKILSTQNTWLSVETVNNDDINIEVPDVLTTATNIEYCWPGKFKPFDHQQITTKFLVENERAYCLNDMGTGKSMSVLWAYDYLKMVGTINRMIVIAPLSTLYQTWGSAIETHFPHLSFSILHGSRQDRINLLSRPADIYIINHDGLKIVGDLIGGREDIDIVVIDEIAQVARNAGTDRWKALRRLVPHPKRRCWALTGAPTPNSPVDAFAQCKLVTPETVPTYRGKFQDMTMKQVGPYKWVPRPDAVDILAKAMSPGIRFKRDECISLPPVTYETRTVELTSQQQDAYKQMLIKLHFEIEGMQITAINEAVKVMKLVQIATGAVYGNDGDTAYIPATNRLQLTHELIEEAGSKVIVFVPFTGALHAVAEYLKKRGRSVEVINGAVSMAERDRIFTAFQHSENPRVIVAQASSMSHGLTLTAASVIIWFAPVNSLETYEQACARISRPGQKLKQLIVNIEGTPVERVIYERLRSRGNFQGILLELINSLREDATYTSALMMASQNQIQQSKFIVAKKSSKPIIVKEEPQKVHTFPSPTDAVLPPAEKIIVECPECNQKRRVLASQAGIITCNNCKHQFSLDFNSKKFHGTKLIDKVDVDTVSNSQSAIKATLAVQNDCKRIYEALTYRYSGEEIGLSEPFSQARNIPLDELVTSSDDNEYGWEFIDACTFSAQHEISEFRHGLCSTNTQSNMLDEHVERFGDDLFEIMQRVTRSVLFDNKELFIDQDDIDKIGEETILLMYRIAMKECKPYMDNHGDLNGH